MLLNAVRTAQKKQNREDVNFRIVLTIPTFVVFLTNTTHEHKYKLYCNWK